MRFALQISMLFVCVPCLANSIAHRPELNRNPTAMNHIVAKLNKPILCGDKSGVWFALRLNINNEEALTSSTGDVWYEFDPTLEIHERNLARKYRKMNRELFGPDALSGFSASVLTMYDYAFFAAGPKERKQLIPALVLPEEDLKISVENLREHFLKLCDTELNYIIDAESLRAWLRQRGDHESPQGAILDLFLSAQISTDQEFAVTLKSTKVTYEPIIDYLAREREQNH